MEVRDVKTISGAAVRVIADITNDYVALKVKGEDGETDHVIVILHSIESILPRGTGDFLTGARGSITSFSRRKSL